MDVAIPKGYREFKTGIDVPEAVAEPLSPHTGATNEGVPLAFNRVPDPRIQDWVSRSMVADADGPNDIVFSGYLCNDASYLRSAVKVDWIAETAEGPIKIRDQSSFAASTQNRGSWNRGAGSRSPD